MSKIDEIEKLLCKMGFKTQKQREWLKGKDFILGNVSVQDLINIGNYDKAIEYLTDMADDMEDNGDL